MRCRDTRSSGDWSADLCFFFFSSRRRHTRLQGDWSSDVCSSDLLIESFVIPLIATIAVCFAYEIFFAQPLWRQSVRGLLPRAEILRDREMLYIAIGILGATVMPHNLYLHSSIVQTRAFGSSSADKREALRFAVFDSTLALAFAFFVNAAILLLAAAAFHSRGITYVAEIKDAYQLLTPVLGAGL